MDYTFRPVAHILTDLPEKFGVPRQSGVVAELSGRIVFEKDYAREEALKGIEGFSHLWLIWVFSESAGAAPKLTVRPPRLGGNRTVGVFASRSPFRPNPIGLSLVKLEGVDVSGGSPELIVKGADLVSGTPILDIKPYLPYCESIPGARGGFTDSVDYETLEVMIPEDIEAAFPAEKLAALRGVLENDPRPHYQDDPDRKYAMYFAGYNVSFRVDERKLYVTSLEKL